MNGSAPGMVDRGCDGRAAPEPSVPAPFAAATAGWVGRAAFTAFGTSGSITVGGASVGGAVATGGRKPVAGTDAAAALEAGFLPASALFGSQLRLRSASAASWPAGRGWTLLTNGFGAFVTYSATPRASASPISRPTTRPMTKPPRCKAAREETDFMPAPDLFACGRGRRRRARRARCG